MRGMYYLIITVICLGFIGFFAVNAKAMSDDDTEAGLALGFEFTRNLNIDDEIRRQEEVIGQIIERLTDHREGRQDLFVANDKSGLAVKILSKSQ